MKLNGYLLTIFGSVVFLLFLTPVLAQQDQDNAILEIAHIEANAKTKTIELYVKAYDTFGAPLLTTDRTNLSARMGRQGYQVSDLLDILVITPLTVDIKSQEDKGVRLASLHVLFLLDISGSMRGDKLEKSKLAIRNILELDMLSGEHSSVEFAWFHDDISESRQLNKAKYATVVDIVDVGPRGQGKNTDLYRAIKVKTEELTQSNADQKVLILLTDGNNDIRDNQNYKGPNGLQPIDQDEILKHVSALDSSFQIFSIGLGIDADEAFLRDLTNQTVNPNDRYSYGVAPDDLVREFVQIASTIGRPNFKIALYPNQEDAVFGPEERTFSLEYKNPSNEQWFNAKKIAVLGSATRSVDLRPGGRTLTNSYIVAFFTGLGLLGALLALLSFLAPIYSEKAFKARHVKKYRDVKRSGVSSKIEAFTQEPFLDDDDVVVNTKGDKMLKLSTWEYLRSEKRESVIGDYAELFTFEAKNDEFFSQRGIFKKLNWLWFGALGGVIAWMLSGFLGSTYLDWYKDLLTVFDDAVKQISPSIFQETITGVAVGAGIVGSLAVAEERGSFRGVNVKRILLRILIGIIAGYLFFFLEAVLIAKYIPYDFWGHLVAWTLFGTVMGFVVTLLSSVQMGSGLKGGVLAGLAAFLLYYLLNLLFKSSTIPIEVVRVVSFFCYGGLLGLILFTVIDKLEAFELLCLSPTTFSGWRSPISKWLKSTDIDFISLGTNPKNRVYIKWEDKAVHPNHARLFMIRQTSYIEPEDGSVMVNSKPINAAFALKDGDLIHLSNQSVLQFIAKEQKQDGVTSRGRNPIKVKKRSPQEVREIRSKIKINKKK
jgi:uncharacterized protein YegL